MRILVALSLLAWHAALGAADEPHSHPAPEKLGTVHFDTSCASEVKGSFDRAVALLHSFAYEVAAREFAAVGERDPGCAMAHWGVAMTQFHQLWSPPDSGALQRGRDEVSAARKVGARTPRERELIDALATFFSDTDPAHHGARLEAYSRAMESVASEFPADDEIQMFHALALIASAPPTDRSHERQKRAADILEPIYRRQPDHPGAAHYLIHAYDSTELASRGLRAARAYAQIAPAAPHALHMPSHIFTRLGLWKDSVRSNEAARRVAHEQGDLGEELHAMDYLTYAYLQRGRDADAESVVRQLETLRQGLSKDFKVSYAATAMPVRLAVERGKWSDALDIQPLTGSPPQVAAIAHWARSLAHAHSGDTQAAESDLDQIKECQTRSAARGDAYWAAQIGVLSREARAAILQAGGNSEGALVELRSAADEEDSLEKLPVTPGPIIPAREQLGLLLLDLHRPQEALQALEQALRDAPGRRGALIGAARAAEQSGDATAAKAFRRALST